MKKIPIAYRHDAGKTQTKDLYWPQICPCCGELTRGNFYNLDCRVDLARTEPGQTFYKSSERYYSLQWRVPYCYDCSKHARNSEIIKSAVILSGIVFFILATLLLAQIGLFVWFPLLLIVLILFDLLLFKIILPRLLRPQMKTGCSTHNFAIHASCQKDHVLFSFDNDNYARAFARINDISLT